MNSIGSSIVIICSHLVLLICSNIAIIVVDFQDQVGQVIRTNHCFKVVNKPVHLGNHNFSTDIGFCSIFLRTNAGFHILKNQFTLKDVPSSFTYAKSASCFL